MGQLTRRRVQDRLVIRLVAATDLIPAIFYILILMSDTGHPIKNLLDLLPEGLKRAFFN